MRTVVITGASSGIGRELALLMASDSRLVLNARRGDALAEVGVQCGAEVQLVVGDIAEASVRSQLASTVAGTGEIVLVNNAGGAEFGDFHGQSLASIETQIAVNFTAAIALCHALTPPMLEQGGQIVNVLSIAATHVFPGSAVYSAAKAGLLQFGRCLAAEYRAQGIRVSSVIPGSTDTPLWTGKAWSPPVEDMLPAKAVAETIRNMILMPRDRSVDEVVIMPPKGIL